MTIHAAIDLGFGFVKVTMASDAASDDARCMSFPSYAATSDNDFQSLERSGVAQIDVVEVVVNNQRYQVGPAVHSCMSGRDLRVASSHFFRSDSYKAIYLGALAYVMSEAASDSKLDVLVVGLPLTVYQEDGLQDDIRRMLTGRHELPVPGSRNQTRVVEVVDTLVVPQTVGSLISLATKDANGGFELMSQGNNLLVDVGYGTMMWMVSAGLTPALARSGANMGGAHTLLNRVLGAVAPRLVDKPFALQRLDDCLRDILGHPLHADMDKIAKAPPSFLDRVVRADVDPVAVSTALQTAMRPNVDEMKARVDDLADIDNVWLTGGASHFYAGEIRKLFPRHEIRCDPEDPRYSNLHGFNFLGRQAASL